MILQRHLVVLAERMADPILGAQDPSRIRMIGEPHAAQVVDLALVPVGRAVQPRQRRCLRQLALLIVLPARQDELDHEAMAVGEALEVVDDLDVRLVPGLGGLLGVRLEVIDPGNVVQQVEAQPGVIFPLSGSNCIR